MFSVPDEDTDFTGRKSSDSSFHSVYSYASSIVINWKFVPKSLIAIYIKRFAKLL